MLGPQAAFSSERKNTCHLPLLSRPFWSARGCCVARVELLQVTCASWSILGQCCPTLFPVELLLCWLFFNAVHLLVFHVFQGLNQLTAMTKLASQFEWGQLYPCLSQLAEIPLTITVSSVNCKRDFSAMKRVRTFKCESSSTLSLPLFPKAQKNKVL